MLLFSSAVLAAPSTPAWEAGAQVLAAPGAPGSSIGLQVGGTVSVRPSALFAVTGASWGQLGGPSDGGSRVQTTQATTRSRGGGMLLADFSPLGGTVVGRPFWLDVGIGPGVVRTVDDLEALQCEGEPSCENTARQWHPAVSWAAGPRVALSSSVGLRIQARGQHWIEVFEGVDLRRQSQLAFGIDLHARFGRTGAYRPTT